MNESTEQPGGLPGSLYAAFAVILLALVLVAALAGGESEPTPSPAAITPEEAEELPEARVDPIPFDGRSPRQLESEEERVLVELARPALAERTDVAELNADEQREYVASLEDEVASLTSALEARGLVLRDVVTFERAWHGFAATAKAADLPRLATLGVRTRPVRRFYPALSEPVPVRRAPEPRTPAEDAPSVALLAGGVPGTTRGFDAVERDDDPSPGKDPRNPRRTEASGRALGTLLTSRGVRVVPIRVSALRAGTGLSGVEEFARTDELLDGLEHAVDPDGDGATTDAVPVALVGVSAPYAGFQDAPEAAAITGAGRLGTLVVGPAGHEGRAAGAYGTLGSPGAAATVAVGALSSDTAVPRAELAIDDVKIPAALLGGAPPRRVLPTSAPVDSSDPAVLGRPGGTPLAGRLAIVRAAANPGAQAAGAAAAGAGAVLLADPRPGHTLPAIPIGRLGVPVLGVTGGAAESMLAAKPGTRVRVEAAEPSSRREGESFGGGGLSPFSSRGPAYGGGRKPDVARAGSAITGGALVSGTAIAAALVAADAARVEARDVPARRRALLAAGGARGPAAGAPRGKLRQARVPLGRLAVTRAESTGVRFTLGTFDRGDPTGAGATRIVPAVRLELTLERSPGGAVVRRLTPPGGERGLLPGEYAFTLPRAVVRSLERGAYRFRARALAPRQRRETVAVSAPFDVP